MKRRAVEAAGVVYWDASALVSMLVEDRHSAAARRVAGDAASSHFVSSLALAEAHAVIGRLVREGILAPERLRDVRARLSGGPWRETRVHPDAGRLGDLALRHPLRGADLWHLAAALALAELLPGVELLSFDEPLGAAAAAEGLLGVRRR
jgi:predicted nucleic acid-binding protein